MNGSVFVSYSHKDAEWLEELKPYLKPLERDGKLDLFEDTQLEPGDDWLDRIQRALERADRAILLVSQDFLASDFISDKELPAILEAARERDLQVISIIVSPVMWENTELAKFQTVNDPSRPLIDLKRGGRARVFLKVQQAVVPPPAESGGNGSQPAIAPEVSEVADWLVKRKLSIYLGSWTAVADPETPPTPGDLIKELLKRLRGQTNLPIPADILGSYFSLSQSPGALDQLIETLINSRVSEPALHKKLAQILRKTQDSPAPRTQGRAKRQLLVVTTNFDLSFERALLTEGVEFYRLIQMRGTGEISVEHFPRPAAVPSAAVLQDDLSSLGRESTLESLAEDANAVLLFKIHGSIDLEESCSISCEHYYQSVRNSEYLPDLLKGSILNNRDLFLGYSLLDGDLRTLSYSLKRDKKPGDAYRGYFVHARPDDKDTDGFRKLEHTLWPRLGLTARALDLELIDKEEDTLLTELLNAVEGA